MGYTKYSETHKREDGGSWYSSSYADLYKAFGEVLADVDIGQYQGDTLVLLKGEDGRLGYLSFGWGSCSVCDALQACNTTEDIDELQQELWDSIKWHDTPASMLDWLKTHDWGGDWSWFGGESKEFVDTAIAAVESIINQS